MTKMRTHRTERMFNNFNVQCYQTIEIRGKRFTSHILRSNEARIIPHLWQMRILSFHLCLKSSAPNNVPPSYPALFVHLAKVSKLFQNNTILKRVINFLEDDIRSNGSSQFLFASDSLSLIWSNHSIKKSILHNKNAIYGMRAQLAMSRRVCFHNLWSRLTYFRLKNSLHLSFSLRMPKSTLVWEEHPYLSLSYPFIGRLIGGLIGG